MRSSPTVLDQAISPSIDGGLSTGRRHRPARRGTRLGDGATSYAALLASALSVPAAAVRLGIDVEGVRRRLSSRQLYGVRMEETWQLPAFQFLHGGGEVPGLHRVFPALDEDLHAMAVWRWLSTPLPELATDDGSWSPLEWLASGRQAGTVVALAHLL
jgi:hypothetical protein